MANSYDEILNAHKGMNSISIGSGNTTVNSAAAKPIHYDAGTTDLDNAIARQQWLADKQKKDTNDIASSYQESINKKALALSNQNPVDNPIINNDLKQHILNSKTIQKDGQSLLPNNNNQLTDINIPNNNKSLTEQNNNPLKDIENKYNNPKQKKLDDINIPISDDQKNNINSLFGTRKTLVDKYNKASKSGDYESMTSAKSQIQNLNNQILNIASTRLKNDKNTDLYKQVTDSVTSTKDKDWIMKNADTKTQNMIQSKQDEQKTFMLDKKYKILQNTREIEALKLKEKEAINSGRVAEAKILAAKAQQTYTNMKITNLSKSQTEKDITDSISSNLGKNFDIYKQQWEEKTGKKYSPADYNSVLSYGAKIFAYTSEDPKVKKIANRIAGVYSGRQNVTDLNAADQLNKLKIEKIKISGKNYTTDVKTYNEKFKAAKSPEEILIGKLKDLKVNGKNATQSSEYTKINKILQSSDQSKMITYLNSRHIYTYRVGTNIFENGKLVPVPKAVDYINTGTVGNTKKGQVVVQQIQGDGVDTGQIGVKNEQQGDQEQDDGKQQGKIVVKKNKNTALKEIINQHLQKKYPTVTEKAIDAYNKYGENVNNFVQKEKNANWGVWGPGIDNTSQKAIDKTGDILTKGHQYLKKSIKKDEINEIKNAKPSDFYKLVNEKSSYKIGDSVAVDITKKGFYTSKEFPGKLIRRDGVSGKLQVVDLPYNARIVKTAHGTVVVYKPKEVENYKKKQEFKKTEELLNDVYGYD